ncbi:hypothetical protein ERJ75_001136900 [Trypanosoma vivax]|nr:hypothetical protein ERJ75_001136900 [Trypanosoma vivax]
MPFISIVCNLVQIAEVVKRDALVDKETEFFAALNAALGVGRDDAPWQWALNSGNARLAGIAQEAIGNWSAEEKITNATAESVCSTKQNARMRRHKGFQRIQQRRCGGRTRYGGDRTRRHKQRRHGARQRKRNQGNHSQWKLCLAATAVYLCTGELQRTRAQLTAKTPRRTDKIRRPNSAGDVAEQWDKLKTAVCHVPTRTELSTTAKTNTPSHSSATACKTGKVGRRKAHTRQLRQLQRGLRHRLHRLRK